MLSLLQRANIPQLIGVKDMDKKKREGLKRPSLFYIYFVQFINIYLNIIYGGTIMEYFDSKVLESFMIPEDSIAIEGFGSKIIEIGKKVINFLITIITKFISILGNLINKFKHGKTVHNDKETYQENKRLVDATYKDLRKLISDIPTALSLTAAGAFKISPASIEVGLRHNKPEDDDALKDLFYDKQMTENNTRLSRLNDIYKNVESKLKSKSLYLDKYSHDAIITAMETAKTRFSHTNENLKKELDMELKNGERYVTEDIIKESQKRYNIVMNYSTKLNTLFNNTVKLITQCVSSDVITDEDVYKYE